MTKTITIPKLPYEKALSEIIENYPSEVIKVSQTTDYVYIIEADESIFNEINGTIGTKIYYLQQIKEIIQKSN